MPEAEIANFMKALGQDMLQIASHEFMAGEGAGFVALGLSILVAEGDAGLVETDQAAIGDGDAEGIAGKVVEHRLLSLAPGLDMDHPALVKDMRGELQLGADFLQAVVKQPCHAFGKGGFGKQEGRISLMPGGAIVGQAAAGDQAVDVRMIIEPLRPTMENGEDTNRAADPARVTAEIDDRLGSCVHQSSIAITLSAPDEGVKFLGQSDGDVEIRDRQHLCLTLLEPVSSLVAMTGRATAVAAAMVDIDLAAAAVASPDLPAERLGSAGKDVGDGASMRRWHHGAMGGQIRFGEPVEDRLQIDQCAGSEAGHDLVQQVTKGGARRFGQVGIAGGGADVGVAEQHLHDADIDAMLQQPGGIAMAERMGCWSGVLILTGPNDGIGEAPRQDFVMNRL